MKEAVDEEVSSKGVLKAFLVEEAVDLAASTALEVVLDMVEAVEAEEGGGGGEGFEEGKLYRSM